MDANRDDLTLVRKVRLQCDPDTYVEAEWGEQGVVLSQKRELKKP